MTNYFKLSLTECKIVDLLLNSAAMITPMKSAPNVDHGSRCGKKSCTDEDIVDWTDSTATYPGRHINEADAISSHESWAHDIGDVDER